MKYNVLCYKVWIDSSLLQWQFINIAPTGIVHVSIYYKMFRQVNIIYSHREMSKKYDYTRHMFSDEIVHYVYRTKLMVLN